MNPLILCHPNIPKPLHGIAPRIIMGQAWWDVERKKAYAHAGFKCEACGIDKRDAEFHQWLEAHEFYIFDYKKGTITFQRLVALCHSCHQFIHDGRMKMLVDAGEMDEEKYRAILRHGHRLLKEAGLLSRYNTRHSVPCSVPWHKWRLVFQGRKYGPSSYDEIGWRRGDWKEWTPDRPAPKPSERAGRMLWNNWDQSVRVRRGGSHRQGLT